MLTISGISGLGPIRLSLVITEQVELLIAFAGGKLLRRGHIIGDDGQASHEQA